MPLSDFLEKANPKRDCGLNGLWNDIGFENYSSSVIKSPKNRQNLLGLHGQLEDGDFYVSQQGICYLATARAAIRQ